MASPDGLTIDRQRNASCKAVIAFLLSSWSDTCGEPDQPLARKYSTRMSKEALVPVSCPLTISSPRNDTSLLPHVTSLLVSIPRFLLRCCASRGGKYTPRLFREQRDKRSVSCAWSAWVRSRQHLPVAALLRPDESQPAGLDELAARHLDRADRAAHRRGHLGQGHLGVLAQ